MTVASCKHSNFPPFCRSYGVGVGKKITCAKYSSFGPFSPVLLEPYEVTDASKNNDKVEVKSKHPDRYLCEPCLAPGCISILKHGDDKAKHVHEYRDGSEILP